MVYPIYTELTECRDCYKCVRACPVKAIQVKDGRAVVVKDRCVFCGRCVDTCPSHAKKIRDDVERVKQCMRSKRQVFASIAPSYAAEFPEQADAFLAALPLLGFSAISETALGAALVSAAIDRYAQDHEGRCPWISTACPSVVELVGKYYPKLVPNLSPIPSPLQCHSILLRQLYGEDITIVFIGPCIAKKVEADTTPGFPDFALTFRELRNWLSDESISLDTLQQELSEGNRLIPELIPARAGESTLYPVEGGMIASLKMGKDVFQASGVAISGAGAVMATLDDLPESSLLPDSPVVFSDFLELLTCEGGCINGPAVVQRRSSAVRKSTSTRFTRKRLASVQPVYQPDPALVDRLLDKGYALLSMPGRFSVYPSATMVPGGRQRSFSDEDIARALFELGKNDPSDELNCGGCGYNSCRDMAVAYLDGMAEPEMCVTKMRKQAQSKIDVLLRTLPMGVVIVDRDMRIVDCNAEFLHMFGDIDYAVEGEIIDLISGLPLQRFVPFYQEFSQHFGDNPGAVAYRLHYKEKFLQVTFFTVENHRLVGAIFQDITTPTVRRETVVKHAEAVIQKSLETVQQIASLLGENAAETEIMLNSLIEAFKVTSGQAPEGFLPDDDQRPVR